MNRASLFPRIVGDLGARAPMDPRAFDVYRVQLTAEFTKLTAWILAILTPLLWPTDALLFADAPHIVRYFAGWRPQIFALAVGALLALRYSAAVRRHATLFSAAILALGAALMGDALGRLGAVGEVYFPCSYLLPLTVVPVIVGPGARVAITILMPLAFTVPYGLANPTYFAANPYAISIVVFQALAVTGCFGLGHSVYLLLRSNFAQREALAAQAALLARAREKSERLLLNMLPDAVATQLKDGAETVADAHEDVTVMFIDICGFTALSGAARPGEVVKMLNAVFSAFDALVERHHVEKIKTIGDAYMVAAGLPEPRPDHAQAIADLALDILAVVARLRDPSGAALQVRVGAHCGPVVAGVIGRKKFIYDLWGDTVNTASRMESHGEAGTIQITEALARRLGPAFRCEPRGAIAVKGKGVMTTYFLRGRAVSHAP